MNTIVHNLYLNTIYIRFKCINEMQFISTNVIVSMLYFITNCIIFVYLCASVLYLVTYKREHSSCHLYLFALCICIFRLMCICIHLFLCVFLSCITEKSIYN